MSDYKNDKGTRLLEMYDILESNGSLSVDDLVRENQVSKKTVLRDISDLRNYYADKYHNGEEVLIYDKAMKRYHLMEHHKTRLSLSQGLMIYQLISNCKFISVQDKINILVVLKSYVKNPKVFEEQIKKLDDSLDSIFETFERCYQIIIDKQKMIFEYQGRRWSGYPLEIVCLSDNMYLIVVDDYGSYFIFDLFHIKTIETLYTAINSSYYGKYQNKQNIKDTIITITYEIDMKLRNEVELRFPSSIILEKKDTTYIMKSVIFQDQLFENDFIKSVSNLKKITK